ncbi:MAG: hypothetical protein RPT25_08500 [Cycloclasticus sp.]|jgi:hypothetical protein
MSVLRDIRSVDKDAGGLVNSRIASAARKSELVREIIVISLKKLELSNE